MMKPIALNDNWMCDYFELAPSIYEFLRGDVVSSLAGWSFDKRRVEGWAAWLQRSFTLEPTDDCVSYLLYIDAAPASTRIFINGQLVGNFTAPHADAPPFEIDVTPYVHLEANTIAFRVDYQAHDAAFTGVRLQAVPCE